MANRDFDRGSISYIHKRDYKSSVRLNYNHWLMKEISGYLLHPKIRLQKEDLRIADVGTGTGIWLLELASYLPSTTSLDGFDISSDQYPPQEWLPPNVHLSVHDSFEPFPSDALGTYDIVNLRFALCYVNNDDAEVLLPNLISLLKPGGYLQWLEPSPLKTEAKASGASTSMAAVQQLARSWHKPKPESSYDWVEGLPGLYEKHGLKLVDYHQIAMEERHRQLWAHSNLMGFEDLVTDFTPIGIEKAESVRQFMGALVAEFAQGVSIETPFLCVVGQRA